MAPSYISLINAASPRFKGWISSRWNRLAAIRVTGSMTGHSYLNELVKNCHQLLGSGGSNDRTVEPIRNPSGRPTLERNAPTIYGS